MTTTIPMMQLRSRPGTYVDRVFYRKESFIVEKTGQPRAVLVPLNIYSEVMRLKQLAKQDFFKLANKIQKRTASQDPKKAQAVINEAIAAGRSSEK